MSRRTEQVANVIQKQAGRFISEKADSSSLITVTSVDVSPDLKNATIFITVLPDDKEEAALSLFRRHLSEFRDLMGNNMDAKHTPFFSVKIDAGEKKRARIDELLSQTDNES